MFLILLVFIHFWICKTCHSSEFCEWVQIEIDVYISHRKYQVKSHSSPWFSAACAATIVHRNHFFFCLDQQNKSFESKGRFRQANNCYKMVLKAAKLAYANETKESITFWKLGSQDFWQIAGSVLSIGKSTIPPLFKSPEMLSSASGNTKLLKTFLRTLFLMTQVSLYLLSLLELIWNCKIFV